MRRVLWTLSGLAVVWVVAMLGMMGRGGGMMSGSGMCGMAGSGGMMPGGMMSGGMPMGGAMGWMMLGMAVTWLVMLGLVGMFVSLIVTLFRDRSNRQP